MIHNFIAPKQFKLIRCSLILEIKKLHPEAGMELFYFLLYLFAIAAVQTIYNLAQCVVFQVIKSIFSFPFRA